MAASALRFGRAIVLVLDSVGVGELPDAGAYGDQGSDTLGNVARCVPLQIPTLRALGLDRVARIGGQILNVDSQARHTVESQDLTPIACFGRMAEASPGKDSVTGHWELMGVVLDRPFPVFPTGFPAAVIDEYERHIGRRTLGNVVASGTQIIDGLGAEHMRTGFPIVYTSADSVFQIAAHEAVVPVVELYRFCEIAYELVCRGLGVGRVIARPFVGEPGRFKRTANRHDYALPPAGETLLDRIASSGRPVVGIGKIPDLFGGHGITRTMKTADDQQVMDAVERAMRDTREGLIFANLVDFDTVYGHRNDVPGYAANLERFDERLAQLLPRLAPEDVLIVTADHGNDPTTPSTDHSREYVPVLVTGQRARRGIDLGVRQTFADVGQTLAEALGVGALKSGRSFLHEIAATV